MDAVVIHLLGNHLVKKRSWTVVPGQFSLEQDRVGSRKPGKSFLGFSVPFSTFCLLGDLVGGAFAVEFGVCLGWSRVISRPFLSIDHGFFPLLCFTRTREDVENLSNKSAVLVSVPENRCRRFRPSIGPEAHPEC